MAFFAFQNAENRMKLEEQLREQEINARKQAELDQEQALFQRGKERATLDASAQDTKMLNNLFQLAKNDGLSDQDAAQQASLNLAKMKAAQPLNQASTAFNEAQQQAGVGPLAKEIGAKQGLANIASNEAAKSGFDLTQLTNRARMSSAPQAAQAQDVNQTAQARQSTAIADTSTPFQYGLIPTQMEAEKAKALESTAQAKYGADVTARLNPQLTAAKQTAQDQSAISQASLVQKAPILGMSNLPNNPIAASALWANPAIKQMLSTALSGLTNSPTSSPVNSPSMNPIPPSGTPGTNTLPNRRVIGTLRRNQ